VLNSDSSDHRGRGGRLQNTRRAEIIEQLIKHLVETGETRYSRLAECVGVSRRRITPLVDEARRQISEEHDLTPVGTRNRLSARLDFLYREALSSYLEAKNCNRLREASDFLRTAADSVAKQAKICGIEGLSATVGANNPKVRITFESFEEAPPAAIGAIARLQAAPGPSSVPRLAGAVQNSSLRRAVGERLCDDDGVASHGNVSVDKATR